MFYSIPLKNFSEKIFYIIGYDPSVEINTYLCDKEICMLYINTDNEAYIKQFELSNKTNGLKKVTKKTFLDQIKTSENYKKEKKYINKLREDELHFSDYEFGKHKISINENSLQRLSVELAYYNFCFNKALAEGATPKDAFKVYAKKIKWKTKDEFTVNLKIENVAKILEEGLNNKNKLWEEFTVENKLYK